MTHVDVVCHAGQIQSIKVEGHAGQDEYGKRSLHVLVSVPQW